MNGKKQSHSMALMLVQNAGADEENNVEADEYKATGLHVDAGEHDEGAGVNQIYYLASKK